MLVLNKEYIRVEVPLESLNSTVWAENKRLMTWKA